MKTKIYRILDANINRAKEGLRIIEDIVRFSLNDEHHTKVIKNIRHQVDNLYNVINYKKLLKGRDSKSDFGQKIKIDNKKNLKDVFVANMKRVQEAIRVIEELTKLLDVNLANNYEKLRFKLYTIEKELFLKFDKRKWK